MSTHKPDTSNQANPLPVAKVAPGKPKPVMLLVLGPHRSGTSLTARMLECLGAVNSKALLPPNEFNPKGYFEDPDTFQFNETVLMPELGSSWHAVSAIDWGCLAEARYQELQQQAVALICKNYSRNNPVSVLKEPRISLLLPFWLEALETAGFAVKAVCPVRHPVSVSQSLAKRDHLPLTSGFLIYLRAWASALKSPGRTPAVYFSFEEVFAATENTLAKIAAQLHLPIPADFKARLEIFTRQHLDESLVHHTPAAIDGRQLVSLPASAASRVYAALLEACETQVGREAERACRDVTDSLQSSADYLRAIDECAAGQLALANQASRLLAEKQAALDRQTAQKAALERHVSELLSSRSWRLTAPYRAVGDWVRKVTHFISLAIGVGCTPGGPGKVWHALTRAPAANAAHTRFEAATSLLLAEANRLSRLDYETWIKRHDTMNDELREKMRRQIADWPDAPLISVLMPVYNPPLQFLREAIESVLAQAYPHWELCLADDCSTDQRVRQILQDYAGKDERIKVEFLASNGGISEASNAALRDAKGEWVALLDHDDLLAEHALFLVAKAARKFPDAQLFYSDEDKIDIYGHRNNPYFKTDWNKALCRSHNLVTHLGVYRTDMVRELGGFRRGLEGAQDYDLVLRFSERVDPRQIIHIPHILYHWRAHAGSTAAPDAQAKPYAMHNGKKALEEHLSRTGQAADVELLEHGFRVRYKLDRFPKVSLLVPTRDRMELISRCVESIRRLTDYPDYEIIIIDNGSTDPAALAYLEQASDFRGVRVLRIEGEFNFSMLNNRAVAECDGEIVALLNSDLEVTQTDWLTEMVSHAVQPGAGAVGALLLFPNDSIQHAGVILGIGGVAGHAHKGFPRDHRGYFGRNCLISEFSALTGACLVVRKSLYQEVGGLDEDNLTVAFNDIDFCLRLRELGYLNIFTPYARFYHHESASRGYEDTPEKMLRHKKEEDFMKDRWGPLLSHDPAYNPNLTLQADDFSFAWPPRIDPLEVRPRPQRLPG